MWWELRHQAPRPGYCVCLRLGNCHVALRRLPKAIHTKGRKETFFTSTTEPLRLPTPSIPFSCFAWQLHSHDHVTTRPVPHSLAGIQSSYKSLPASPYLGTSSFLWLGDPHPHLHTGSLFQNVQKPHSIWMASIQHCSLFHGSLETQLMYSFVRTRASCSCHGID